MSSLINKELRGYLRPDGRKGIRNIVVVAYLVECAHHVAREIVDVFRGRDVQLIGFGGCYPNAYADKMMNALCIHPNVGAVLLVSLGCESFNRKRLYQTVKESGRPVKLLGIQETGGTKKTISEGTAFVSAALEDIKSTPVVDMDVTDIVVGVVSGGSDATSGITANPAVGKAFDILVEKGGTAIFENIGEMIGLDDLIAQRGITPALRDELRKAMEKSAKYYTIMGHGSFAPGNADGGLTTQEEKGMGAYYKGGTALISGMIKPADIPPHKGLYLMDIVPDGEPRFGFPNPNDSSEIAELIASGALCVLFTTGRGSVVGSAIAPVIKVCANPDTYARMQDDMDINAGKVLTEGVSLDEMGNEIFNKIISVAGGEHTCSEALGHQEFVLGYKTFEPVGPSCLP
ncbi:MAG: UxaA family hydrolase [Chitinophagaceae bacterium]|nr:UxaA family hydrolase [Chitinophagaceae bacterium]